MSGIPHGIPHSGAGGQCVSGIPPLSGIPPYACLESLDYACLESLGSLANKHALALNLSRTGQAVAVVLEGA